MSITDGVMMRNNILPPIDKQPPFFEGDKVHFFYPGGTGQLINGTVKSLYNLDRIAVRDGGGGMWIRATYTVRRGWREDE